MGAIKVNTFAGMSPATDDRLLLDSDAALAQDTYLYSGALVGLPTPKLLRALTDPAASKIYRLPASYTASTYIPGSTYLEFQNPDTDVIRSPVFGETYDRYYWASSAAVPRYNTRARINAGNSGGNAPFKLGIPVPATPTMGVAGGTAPNVTRAYVYTWVSAYGEEGPPSLPVLTTNHPDGVWTITMTAAAALDLGTDRNLTKTRIYRTITASDGSTTYFFVAEQAIATLTYADSASDATIALNNQLLSQYWTGPPTDLQGMIQMPNGIVAGWRANELWFSEPYLPHAWPVSYVLTTEFPIVGLGLVNQTLVACTTGRPVTASGVTPGYISLSTLAAFEPCLGRGSILGAPEGVYYTSANGLILVNPGQATNITRELVNRDKWQQLTKGTPFRAARFGSAYYAFGVARIGVFEATAFEPTAFAQTDYSGAYLGVFLEPLTPHVGVISGVIPTLRAGLFSLLSSTLPMVNVQNDPWSSEVFLIKNSNVYLIDQSDATVSPQAYTWRSKKWQNSYKRNFGAMRVYFENPPGVTPGSNDIVTVYGDDAVIYTRQLVKSGELWKLPSGNKYDFVQFQIASSLRIKSVQIATSDKELKKV